MRNLPIALFIAALCFTTPALAEDVSGWGDGGHSAGYSYAKRHHIDDWGLCRLLGCLTCTEFREGCEDYAKEQQEEDEQFRRRFDMEMGRRRRGSE